MALDRKLVSLILVFFSYGALASRAAWPCPSGLLSPTPGGFMDFRRSLEADFSHFTTIASRNARGEDYLRQLYSELTGPSTPEDERDTLHQQLVVIEAQLRSEPALAERALRKVDASLQHFASGRAATIFESFLLADLI